MKPTEITIRFEDEHEESALVQTIPNKGHVIVVTESDLDEGRGYAAHWSSRCVGHWRVIDVEHHSVGRYADGSTRVVLCLEQIPVGE